MKQIEELEEVTKGFKPSEDQKQLSKREQAKKSLEEEISSLKESTDEAKLRQYHLRVLKLNSILSLEGIKRNRAEIEGIEVAEAQPKKSPLTPEQVAFPVRSVEEARA